MKDLQEDNVFDSIRERMGGYEEAPSDALWSKIEKRKRKAAPVWIVAGIGAVAIVAGLFFITDDKAVEVKKTFIESKPEIVINRSNKTEEQTVTQQPTRQVIQVPIPILPVTQKNIETLPQPETRNYKPETTTTDSIKTISPTPKKDSSSVTTVVPPYKKPHSKFQLYFSVTPSLSFQKIIPGGSDNIIVQGLKSNSPLSMKRFGFGIDAGFQRDINNIFGFYGGVSFYRQHQELTYNYYSKDGDVTRVGDTWVWEINRPVYSRTFDYTMTNLGVRSGILVTLKGEKLKHKFGTGLSYSHGFAKADSQGSYNNSQSSYLAYQVFYRSEIKINDWFSWYLEPTFNYSFISKEKLAEPFSLKPYRAGISGGVLYRF